MSPTRDPGAARTGSYAQNGNARPLGKGTGRRGNVLGDARHSTGFDPLAGWLERGKPSRTKRQPKPQ
jgi:hypothetical protein